MLQPGGDRRAPAADELAEKRVGQPQPEDDPRRRKPDISRASELLDWRPTVDLEQGLEATIAWFEDEQNRVVQPMFVDVPAVATAAE